MHSAAGATNASGAKASVAAPVAVTAKSDTEERTFVIENDVCRVEFSNRGGVVKSWQLKKYSDDSKPPRILDVVHPHAAETSGWPFAVVLNDEQQQTAANTALYQMTTAANVASPTDVDFSWSDGHLEVTKHFHFDKGYVVRAEVSAKVDGAPILAGLGWLGGFGDLTVTNPAPWETVETYYSEGGKISTFLHKKLDGPDKWNGVWQGGKDFAGIEDRYFTAAFLPANGAAAGTLGTRYWKGSDTEKVANQETQVPVSEVATTVTGQPTTALRVYVGPKDYDELKRMNPPLHGLVNFGWLEFIADPLFHALKWLHNYIPNWGWAIVVLTLIINMLLFPLRISSYRTTLKMQRVGPEIKAIQDKFKNIPCAIRAKRK